MTSKKRSLSSNAAKFGQKFRGLEALEPRTVLSGMAAPFYSPGPSAPPPVPAADMLTRQTAGLAPPQYVERGELADYRFEPHRQLDAAATPWQITIIVLPAGGVVVDRGSPAQSESHPYSGGVQAATSTSPHAASLVGLSRVESSLLDGAQNDSLITSLAAAPSQGTSSDSVDVSGASSLSDKRENLRTAALPNVKALERATSEQVIQPAAQPEDELIDSEAADSPSRPRRKLLRTDPAVSAIAPRLGNPVAPLSDSPDRRLGGPHNNDPFAEPSRAASDAPLNSRDASSNSDDLIELIAADVARVVSAADQGRNEQGPLGALHAAIPFAPEAGLQLYQAFEIGEGQPPRPADAAVAAAEARTDADAVE